MKKAIFLIGLFVILLGRIGVSQDLVSGNFDKNTFTFNFSFENNEKETLYITKIGATTQVNFGEFSCPAKDGIKEPLSDFVLYFEPQTESLLLNSYIGIKIEPGEIRSFTFSILPNITRACDDWAFEVTAMIRFNSGYTFWSASELLLSDNYNSLSSDKLSDQEIQDNIYKPGSQNRIRALRSLQYSGLSQAVKERLCAATIDDKDVTVRTATAIAIKDNNLTFLSDLLISNLFSAQNSSEKLDIIRILGAMKDPKFIDPLIGVLINGDLEQAEMATKALIRINRNDIKAKISYMFKKNTAWAMGDEIQKEKFLLMAEIIIHFNDESSGKSLIDFFNNPVGDVELKYNLIDVLSGQINAYQRDNSFIAMFNETVEPYLKNKNGYVRYNSLNVYLASSSSEKDQKKVIKKALKDTEFSIQCKAAVWAGELGFEEFKDDVQVLCNDSNSPGYDEICQALIKLKSTEE